MATTQLTLQRLLPSTDGLPFGWVLVAGGGFALALPAAGASPLEAGRHDGRIVGLSAPVYASASWTFKDSWATNITAVGALVGTFLAASSSVASMFPGVPLYRFTIANAACGALVVVVPLAGRRVQRPDGDGSRCWQPPSRGGRRRLPRCRARGRHPHHVRGGAELTLFGILIDVSAATGAGRWPSSSSWRSRRWSSLSMRCSPPQRLNDLLRHRRGQVRCASPRCCPRRGIGGPSSARSLALARAADVLGARPLRRHLAHVCSDPSGQPVRLAEPVTCRGAHLPRVTGILPSRPSIHRPMLSQKRNKFPGSGTKHADQHEDCQRRSTPCPGATSGRRIGMEAWLF